ncbi:MAG: mechanosensitive ion channel [Bacteroidales bacterium]|nr:mechanosensitive ion channel [Bacteroidales bacterium]
MTLREYIEFKLIDTEKVDITIYHLIVIAVIIIATWLILRVVKKLLNRQVKYNKIDIGQKYAIYQIIKYLIWIIAIGILVESVGLKLNILIASSAALLVGLGLGLQQVFSDYVSGILILFEGNLKVKDVVQLRDIIGEVTQIGLRTSKIETRDNYIIIVPNHKFTNDEIVNWSHIETKTRFHVNVGVAYGSEARLVERVLLDCAKTNKDISNTPAPFVRFDDFGNSSLDFQLYFFTRKSFRVENIKSDMRFLIDEKFRENNIRIPFPQMDVHVSET